jgi:hypothetical protein
MRKNALSGGCQALKAYLRTKGPPGVTDERTYPSAANILVDAYESRVAILDLSQKRWVIFILSST